MTFAHVYTLRKPGSPKRTRKSTTVAADTQILIDLNDSVFASFGQPPDGHTFMQGAFPQRKQEMEKKDMPAEGNRPFSNRITCLKEGLASGKSFSSRQATIQLMQPLHRLISKEKPNCFICNSPFLFHFNDLPHGKLQETLPEIFMIQLVLLRITGPYIPGNRKSDHSNRVQSTD